jgi:hypothetical protein
MAPRKNKRNDASRAIAQAIIDQYQPTNAEEMQDALKGIFGPMFEAMLQGAHAMSPALRTKFCPCMQGHEPA